MANTDSSKRDRIIEAAIAAFLRHGPRHIAMEDIAEVAGMSRPSLYQIFKNKQALFRAVVEHMHADLLNGVRLALAGDEPLDVRLGNALVAREGAFFRLLHASPHARALDEAHMSSASDVTEHAETEYQSMLAGSMIAEGVRKDAAGSAALFLSATAHGLKRDATSPDAFDQTLRDAATLMSRAIMTR